MLGAFPVIGFMGFFLSFCFAYGVWGSVRQGFMEWSLIFEESGILEFQ